MPSPVTIKNIEILSDEVYPLKKITFDRQQLNGAWLTQKREIYDRGNAATILLYNLEKGTVLLTRQFRLATYINGNPTGMLIEACAGMLDKENPEECVRRETEEETGYRLTDVKKIFECYMSAGGLTEFLYFFTGTYNDKNKVSDGGGLKEEHEDIEVIELPFEKALAMMDSGEIKDAKTVLLLQYARWQQLFKHSKYQ